MMTTVKTTQQIQQCSMIMYRLQNTSFKEPHFINLNP